MFDPQTARLIRDVPRLTGLDVDRLPQRLTQAFAEIVAFRVRMGPAAGDLPAKLVSELESFRRMAHTFESVVALLPSRSDRAASAYVAAQAHHLLYMARSLSTPSEIQRPFRPEAISPTVSALLLFLIADQPSDAMDMANALRLETGSVTRVEAQLVDALAALAEGNLGLIAELPENGLAADNDAEELAVQALYHRLLQGLRILGRRLLLGADMTTSPVTPAEIFQEVQRLSSFPIPDPLLQRAMNGQFTPVSIFAGPHQLAALLLGAASRLEECATSNVRMPPGVNTAAWNEFLKNVVSKRPFLWRNHRDAITQGLLGSGTSAVISFPTGAGKTTISELKIASTLATGASVLYLAPTHALVAQVKRTLRETFPRITIRESLISEDFYAEIEEEAVADVAVMTPERCLALLGIAPEPFGRIGLVVFDECHLLHAQEDLSRMRRSIDAMLTVLHLARITRGTDWLFLSAMMSNSEELAKWLQELSGQTCLALNLEWKPTRQARGCLVFEQEEIDRLDGLVKSEQAKSKRATPSEDVQALFKAKPFGFFSLEQTWQSTKVKDYTLQPLLDEEVALSVAKHSKRKLWVLNPNKSSVAAHLAAKCAERGLRVLLFGQTIPIAANLAELVESHLEKSTESISFLLDEKFLKTWALMEVGVEEATYCCYRGRATCHHGDMLPVERELAERLFRRSDGIRALAATTTLAQGVNLPADIVFIVGDSRWNAKNKKNELIDAHELLNAAGRAGRAGHVAQGLVIVLPNNLVGFDESKRKIRKGWHELRTGIFSKPDQCLRIQDPIERMLDLLQDSSYDRNSEIEYFLRRLPVASNENPDAPAEFLRSSLAAYHARRSKQEDRFETQLRIALNKRDPALRSDEQHDWQSVLAVQSGVDAGVIHALDEALLNTHNTAPTGTEEWLRWFCAWLGRDERVRKMLLRHEPETKGEEAKQFELFGDELFRVTWAWMSGEPLSNLARMLGDNRTKLGSTRHFVLRRVPDLAFGIGLVTQVYRAHLERGLAHGRMPTSLATISLCVRIGQSCPEEIAVRFETDQPYAARQAVRRLWESCRYLAPAGRSDEGFGSTRRRALAALRSFLPSGDYADWLATEGAEDSDADEMPWDTAAREAVEIALTAATWDEATHTVTLYDADDPRVQVTVRTREELETHLQEIASSAFYANCSRDEGDFVATCDEEGIVEDVLSSVEERISRVFRRRGGRK